MSYKAQQDAADSAENIAEYNAQVASIQASEEVRQRAVQGKEERRRNRQRMAAIEGMYAKSGVLLEGTPGALIERQATVDELNIQDANRNAKVRANLLRAQAAGTLAEGKARASLLRKQANAELVGALSKMAMNGYGGQYGGGTT